MQCFTEGENVSVPLWNGPAFAKYDFVSRKEKQDASYRF